MQADKKHILNRLATIEGHLRGIRKMVEDDQYCVDILRQSYAVERAHALDYGKSRNGRRARTLRAGLRGRHTPR